MSEFNKQQMSDGLHFTKISFTQMVKDIPENKRPDAKLIDLWTKAAGQLSSKDRISVIVDLQNKLQQQKSLGIRNYICRIRDTNFLIKKLYSHRGEKSPLVHLHYPLEFSSGDTRSGLQGYWRKSDSSHELYDIDTGFYAGKICKDNGHIIHATEKEKYDIDPICVPYDELEYK